jgi:ubiquinone/menaquinone biosynthesis C-methylase UbiE
MTDDPLNIQRNELDLDDVKDEVRKRWDLHCKYYDGCGGKKTDDLFWMDESDKCYMSEFSSAIGQDQKKILDVGSGTGYVSLILARLGHEVTGIDFSHEMLALSSTKAKKMGLKVRFIEGDAENIPLPSGSFDVVINRHLLWTLPNPKKAIREWTRLCKPGGKLIIIDGTQSGSDQLRRLVRFPFLVWILLKEGRTLNEILHYGLPNDKQEKIPHYHGITADQIAAYMNDCGLSDISCKDLGYIRDISLRNYPWYERPVHKGLFEYHTYLVSGRIKDDDSR